MKADKRSVQRDVGDLEDENEYKRLQIGRLEQQIQIESLRSTVLLNRLSEVEAKLKEHQNELQRVTSELRRVTDTTAWRLIERYWNFNMRWFPAGTRRRVIYNSLTEGAANLLRLGSQNSEHPNDGQPEESFEQENEDLLIQCDTPIPGEYCAGTLLIRGKTITRIPIQRIHILLDDQQIAESSLGQSCDNVILDPFSFFVSWDTKLAKEGPHSLSVIATAKTGTCRTVSIPITIDQQARERSYQLWMAINELSAGDSLELRKTAENLEYQPTFGIVLSAAWATPSNLRMTIESIRKQIYQNWELWIVSESSATPNLRRLIAHYVDLDPRIKFTETQGKSTSATILSESTLFGSCGFVGFLDEGDELAPNALYEVARILGQFPESDLIYSDEDTIDQLGRRSDPFFKPDWSPDLFLSMNYVSRFLVLRRELIVAIGGLFNDKDERYGLVLRAVEKTDRIRHIPWILYHKGLAHRLSLSNRKVAADSTGAARAAIAEYLRRNNICASVEEGVEPGRWRVRYRIAEDPVVNLIIAAGPRVDLLRRCLDSILNKTAYHNFKVTAVDNSKGREVRELLEKFRTATHPVIYLDYRENPFNFSAMNNLAVREIEAPLVLFLNDDTEVIDEHWLSALVEHGQRPSVGVVGAKLIYPFGLIQHAGMVMGIHGTCGHAFKYLPADSHDYFDFAQIVRNCSSVTGACMLTNRNLFLKLGGFNEIELAGGFQDPDYCLRVCQAGLLVVYTPHAVLVHHESASKGFAVRPSEESYIQEKWSAAIAQDPYYSPHLTRKAEDFGIRFD